MTTTATTPSVRERVRTFRAWFLLYSFAYFASLDLTGIGPGQEDGTGHKAINYGVLLVGSIALYRWSWDRLRASLPGLSPAEVTKRYVEGIVKLFLLALGANGLITLEHHHGVARTFYVANFIVLWVYAVPALVVYVRRLRAEIRGEVGAGGAP